MIYSSLCLCLSLLALCSLPRSSLGQQEEVTKTISGVPYKLSGDSTKALRRIEFVSVTVDDLDLSSQFYGDVLGGVEIEFCDESGVSQGFCDSSSGAVRYSGDQHMAATFVHGADGINPDISSGGEFEVLSKFYILGNSIIQLVKFAAKADGSLFNLRESMTSPCWMSKAHLDFWIENDIDANDYIADVEARAADLGGGGMDVKFNRPVPQESREDRDEVPVEQYANKVVGGSFDGLAWAYFKGPSGEQLEIYQIDRTMRRSLGAAYCTRGAVSTGFVNDAALSSNTSQYGWGGGAGTPSEKNYTSQRLHGLFQYGFRTADLHTATGFYTEVLGGDLITHPTQGIEIMRDDSAHWMILANETIEAYEYSDSTGGDVSREEALRVYGVANISSLGYSRLDHRFVLFDNFVVEPLEYTDGLTFGATGFDPTLDYEPSSAYIGTITAAFGVDRNASGFNSLADYLADLSVTLEQQGYAAKVTMPQVASFDDVAGHPYEGLEYGFMSGPDKEVIQLVYIAGPFQEKLHSALVSAGGVSTMFEETNPFASGDMDLFCPYALYSAQYATMTSATTPDECSYTTTNTYYDQSDDDADVWTLASVLVLVFCVSSFGLLLYVIALLKQVSNHMHTPPPTTSMFNRKSSVTSIEKNAKVPSSADSTLSTPLL
mmetsp:Transcript_1734/g.3254  ORF Transcript_1734/g.3254 Transcript_1734/m.3254 type:complete len:662 (+) Transcript_1734:111-2096(+)